MEKKDVKEVSLLLAKYLSQFKLAPLFSDGDIAHWFLPRSNVISCYVVEDAKTHAITGFTSFYTLPSSILGNPKYSTLMAAYSYYNVNTVGSIKDLVEDALIIAKQVFLLVLYAVTYSGKLRCFQLLGPYGKRIIFERP